MAEPIQLLSDSAIRRPQAGSQVHSSLLFEGLGTSHTQWALAMPPGVLEGFDNATKQQTNIENLMLISNILDQRNQEVLMPKVSVIGTGSEEQEVGTSICAA